MGEYNSSITRVRPFFQQLLQRDPSGREWLPKLLLAAEPRTPLALRLAKNPGVLSTHVRSKRGHKGCLLEECFEASTPPSKRFLTWLVEHPEHLTWPETHGIRVVFGESTQVWREKLTGKRGKEAQRQAIREALAQINAKGASGSKMKWWAFEGFTEVDCRLETEKLVLFVEGKRLDTVSKKTSWHEGRNQLIRNLEVAKEQSGGKEFAVLLMAEEITTITPDEITRSLPHLLGVERADLMSHFLGCVLWRQACEVTGIEYSSLPNTVADVTR